MSVTDSLRADGSARSDARERVLVDREREPYRWACPNGHVDWDRTNSHVWCRGCRRRAEAGGRVDPEHYEIVDRKTGETVPWSAVELVERY